MSDTLTVEIPADVKDNSETVTDYAFMRHRSPDGGRRSPEDRDRDLVYADTFGYAHYQWHDTAQGNRQGWGAGQRVRFDMLVNRDGRVVHLYVTEYWTRVGCTDCEYSYAQSYIAITDWDGRTHSAAPFCDEHGSVVKRITDQQRGYSWTESERLWIGQHD